MKNLVRVGVATVAAVMITGGGAALAGEEKTPDPGTYEFKEALETGGLPAESGSALTPGGPRKMGAAEVGTFVYLGHPFTAGQAGATGEANATVEIGGTLYRVGIDAP